MVVMYDSPPPRGYLWPWGLLSGPSTRQSDGQHIGVVKVSAVLVDMLPELVDEPAPTYTTGDDGGTGCMSPLVWQTVFGDGL